MKRLSVHRLSLEILKTSLKILVDSFRAEDCRGYHQGKAAYEAWIRGLLEESDFQLAGDKENVLRRLNVNDSMLCSLIDARRSAASYLQENCSLLAELILGQGQEMRSYDRIFLDI